MYIENLDTEKKRDNYEKIIKIIRDKMQEKLTVVKELREEEAQIQRKLQALDQMELLGTIEIESKYEAEINQV